MANHLLLENQIHGGEDPECSACAAGYSTRCVCGGLIHAAAEAAEESDAFVATQRGKCGRSEDDLEEDIA
jgi:hypothetical protein